MILTNFWVVRNPGPKSGLSDICMHMNSFSEFMNYMRGTQVGRSLREVEDENHIIHTDEASARMDAECRLRIFRELHGKMAAHHTIMMQKADLERTENETKR